MASVGRLSPLRIGRSPKKFRDQARRRTVPSKRWPGPPTTRRAPTPIRNVLCSLRVHFWLLPPLQVQIATAVPLAVPRPVDVQAQPGLHADDGAVGVEPPLLVGAAVAVPDLRPGCPAWWRGRARRGTCCRRPSAGCSTVARPLLVGAAVAVPDVHERAVGLAGAVARPGTGRSRRRAGCQPVRRCRRVPGGDRSGCRTGRSRPGPVPIADQAGAERGVVDRADRRAVDRRR